MAWLLGSGVKRALWLCGYVWLGACGGSQKSEADDAALADAEAEAEAEDASADHAEPHDAGAGPEDSGPIELPCTVNPPTSCPTPPVRYADIVPILEQRCLSCHDGLGEQWPLTTYSHVAGWFNEIRAAMTTCSMPPADAGIAVPAKERETILAWLVCGMPR